MKKFCRTVRRLASGAIAAAMCVGFFTGAAPKEEGEKLILGEFLRLTASGGGEALVDNSGMSGIESSVHFAGTDTADMYTFAAGETLVLSLTRAEPLGQFYIWNYNDPAALDCGVKELNIKVSADGSQWTDAGTVTLPMQSGEEDETYGGSVACNLDEPFNFGGTAAKYIALTPVSNHGGGLTGLSEVRVFRHKTRPGVGDMVQGEVIITTPGDHPEAAVNGQGISEYGSASAGHSNLPADMWLTSGLSAEESYFPVNLDGTYPLESLTIWNYNDPSALDRGIKEFEVYYTVEAPCDIDTVMENDKAVSQTFDFSGGMWLKLKIDGESVFTLPRGTGEDNMGASLTLKFDEVIEAQHIKIVPVSNYGGSGYGMSEVMFFAGKGWGVEPQREWTGLLSSSGTFDYQGSAYGRQGGWIYADGVYSYHMNGAQSQGSLREDSVIFITFEDTCIGEMGNYKGFNSRTGYTQAKHSGWVNMSYLVIKGNKPDVRNATFIMEGKDSDKHPLNNIMAKQYWTGDFTLIDGSLYVHAPDISDQDSGVPVDMVKIYFNDDLTPNMNIVPEVVASEIPAFADGTIYENTEEAGAPNPDGYIYVFTEKSKGNYRVCRVKPEDFATNFDKYEFWGGEDKGWVVGDESVTKVIGANVSSYDPGGEAAIAYMPDGYFGGKYVNVFTDGSIFGQLKMGIADSLIGKYAGEIDEETGKQGNYPISLFWATEKYKYALYSGYDAVNQWNYNSKSHPALSEEGELLISYHIGAQNSTDMKMAMEYTHPVFVNLFSIGDFGSTSTGLIIAVSAAAGAAVVLVAVIVTVSVRSAGRKKKAAAAAAAAASGEAAEVPESAASPAGNEGSSGETGE